MIVDITEDNGSVTLKYGWSSQPTSSVSSVTVSSESILTEVRRFKYPRGGFLPAAVRWMSADRKVVVFERPPMEMTVTMAYEVQEYAERETTARKFYNLPIPWTVYVVAFNANYDPCEIYTYVRYEQLQSLQDELFLLPLPNFYANGKLCNPVYATAEMYDQDITTGITRAFSMVWGSGYNKDLTEITDLARDEGIPVFGYYGSDLDAWLDAWSKIPLTEILRRPFPPTFTLEEYVDEDDDRDSILNLETILDWVSNRSGLDSSNPYTFAQTLANIATGLSTT